MSLRLRPPERDIRVDLNLDLISASLVATISGLEFHHIVHD
jgi:hypothetical protein